MQQEVTFDYSFEVPGKIWKVSMDNQSGNLAFEIRDEAAQEVFFLLFQWESKSLSEYIQIPDSNWWTTLLTFEGNLFFLNKYSDKNDPASKTLMIYDKENEKLTCYPKAFLVDSTSDSYTIEKEDGTRERILFPTFTPTQLVCKFPDAFLPDSEGFRSIQTFLGKEIAWGIEYFEEAENGVFSYSAPTGLGFARFLMIIQNEEVRYHIQIEDQITGFAPGSFFIIDQSVVFVSNSNQFNVIHL